MDSLLLDPGRADEDHTLALQAMLPWANPVDESTTLWSGVVRPIVGFGSPIFTLGFLLRGQGGCFFISLYLPKTPARGVRVGERYIPESGGFKSLHLSIPRAWK